MDYKELLNLAAIEMRQNKNDKAYEILMANKEAYVKDTKLYYFTIYLACALNKIDDALYHLKEAIIDQDMWFNIDFLDKDVTLDVIREYDEFKEIYNICKQRQVDLRFSGEKKMDLFIPDPHTKKLFFMLPGDFQTIDEVKSVFNSNLIENHLIAIPQPRELHSYNQYLWGDTDFGVKVIVEHYKDIQSQFPISSNETILSSFASGAKILLKALLQNELSSNKILLFAPAIPELDEMESTFKTLREQNIKFFIVCGKEDSHYLPYTKKIDELFTKHEVSHKVLLIEGMGHSFPQNTKEIIDQAIEYFR